MARLKDIANEVGVSITTVSLVLNGGGAPTRVGERTAERIRAKAAELGYRPNAAAQHLATGASGLFALVTRGLYDTLNLRRVEATIRAVLASGYQPLVWGEEWSNTSWESILDVLVRNDVEGAIISGAATREPPAEFVEQLRNTNIPCVSLEAGDQLPGAGVDRRDAFYRLTHAALEAEHRSIGYLHSGSRALARHSRLAGVETAIAEHEADVALRVFAPLETVEPPAATAAGELPFVVGRLGADQFIDSDDPPTAMICYCDAAAISFMHAIQSAGIEVPGDVSVFGFDGSLEAGYSHPPLTTVAQPLENVANEAVRRLVELTKHPEDASDEYALFSGPLIVRESSGPCRATDVPRE